MSDRLRGFLTVTAFDVVELHGSLFWQTSYGNGDVELDVVPEEAVGPLREGYPVFPVSARRLVTDRFITREMLRDKIGFELADA